MRWFALVVLFAGCGRYGFDRTVEADSVSDAGPDDGATASDAARDGAAIACPAQYAFAIGSSRYRRGNQTEWTLAEASCEADGAGIHLAVIDNASEMTMLAALSGNSRTWVGVSDRKTDNVFLRVTGGVAPFLPWRNGDPSQAGSACAAWDPPSQYRDEQCVQGRQFVCECDGIPVDSTAY